MYRLQVNSSMFYFCSEVDTEGARKFYKITAWKQDTTACLNLDLAAVEKEVISSQLKADFQIVTSLIF